jgi:hypothetical protein
MVGHAGQAVHFVLDRQIVKERVTADDRAESAIQRKARHPLVLDVYPAFDLWRPCLQFLSEQVEHTCGLVDAGDFQPFLGKYEGQPSRSTGEIENRTAKGPGFVQVPCYFGFSAETNGDVIVFDYQVGLFRTVHHGLLTCSLGSHRCATLRSRLSRKTQ